MVQELSQVDLGYVKDLKIKDIFYDNKFNIFVKYCEEKNIHYLADLINFDFNELKNIKGLGSGKIKLIKERYYSICPTAEKFVNDNYPSEIIFDNINQSLLEYDVNFFISLGLNKKLIKLLNKNGYKKIKDLQNIDKKIFSKQLNIKDFSPFYDLEKNLTKDSVELLEMLLESCIDDENYQMCLKRSEGKTLEEIGYEYGLTRERIRQKLNKFYARIEPFLVSIFNKYIEQKGYFTLQEVLDIYDNDDYDRILFNWCIKNEYFNFLDFAEVFISSKIDLAEYKNKLLEISEDFIGDGINIYDNLEELETIMKKNNLEYIDALSFINFAKINGYKDYKYFLIKGSQSYGYLGSLVIADKFPNGIKLYNSEDLTKLREYIYNEYGDISVAENDRAFSTRFSDYLILSDRGSGIAPSRVKVDMNLLDEIRTYIDNANQREVYYFELYTKFKEKLDQQSNINNQHFLHGVLKYYFEDFFDFSNRDYLKKRGRGFISKSFKDRIVEFIENYGNPVSKKMLKEKLANFSDIVIINAIESDTNLMQWDFNYYYSMSLLDINSEDKKYLYNALETILENNNGYCTDSIFLENMKNSNSIFLEKNGISEPINLFYILQKLFGEQFDFKRPHICKKNIVKEVNLKNVAMYLLGNSNIISLSKYKELTERYMWSDATSQTFLTDIEDNYIRISYDEYMNKNYFEINDSDIKGIINVVKEYFSDGVMSLINFDDFSEFPKIKYEWNQHLLRSIIINFIPDFSIIEPSAKDRRYVKTIIIDSNMKIDNYQDLIIYLLKLEKISEISKADLFKFLLDRNLTTKLIPKDIYDSEKIIHKNDIFKIN